MWRDYSSAEDKNESVLILHAIACGEQMMMAVNMDLCIVPCDEIFGWCLLVLPRLGHYLTYVHEVVHTIRTKYDC